MTVPTPQDLPRGMPDEQAEESGIRKQLRGQSLTLYVVCCRCGKGGQPPTKSWASLSLWDPSDSKHKLNSKGVSYHSCKRK